MAVEDASAVIRFPRGPGAACAAAIFLACASAPPNNDSTGWTAAENQCARWADGRFYCTSAPDRRFEQPRPLEVPLQLTTFSGSTWAACGLDAATNAYCWRWTQTFENQREVLTLGVDSLSRRSEHAIASIASNGADWVCGTERQGLAWCAAILPVDQQSCVHDARNTLCRPEPVLVSSTVRFAQVDVGEAPHGSYGFACGLALDGQVYCWHRDGVFLFTETGDPELCRVPRLKLFNCVREPRPVHTAARFTSVSVGMGYACGVTTGSRLLCWGYSGPLETAAAFQNCDYRADFLCMTVPSAVVGLGEIIAADAGELHTCAIMQDRSAVCWGNGSMSQLGARSNTSSSFGDATLVTVQGGHRWSEITAGPFLTCGITVRSEWYCWGQQPVDNPAFTGPQRIPDPVLLSR